MWYYENRKGENVMELIQNVLASFIAMWLICSFIGLWYYIYWGRVQPKQYTGSYINLLFWSFFWGPFTVGSILLQITRDIDSV
jgi:predicted membrane protein